MQLTRINRFLFATGSFCTDSSVRTLLSGKALWTSLKIFSLLFSTFLIFMARRRMRRRRLRRLSLSPAREAGGFLALGSMVSFLMSFTKFSGWEIPTAEGEEPLMGGAPHSKAISRADIHSAQGANQKYFMCAGHAVINPRQIDTLAFVERSLTSYHVLFHIRHCSRGPAVGF